MSSCPQASLKNYLRAVLALQGGTALTALLAGGTASVYYEQAPDNSAYPYVVFNLQGGGDQNLTPSRMKNYLYFVRGYTKTSSAQAGSIDAQIDALLHLKTLVVTGWANFWTARNTDLENVENEPNGNKTYMAGGIYNIRLDS